MAEDGNKICILVLIGLPGSGKTYLTNFLINLFKNSNLNLKCNVLPFTYDELMPNLEASSCENMKDKRKEILNSVKNAIEKINLQNNSKSSKDGNNPLEPSKMSTLLVIDDNMYYRSMRYEYFKLSKLMRVGFCQIYLEASLEQSISVNSKINISSQVTHNTILRMNNLIQIPNVKNNWEKRTIFIPFHCSLENSEVLQKILCLIKEASLTDLPEDGMKIKDKNSNINSLVHNVDLSFRWLIRNNITSFKRSGNEEIRSYANELNARKSKILKDLRAGSLLLPKSVVDALENQTSQNKELIHNFFHNILSNN